MHTVVHHEYASTPSVAKVMAEYAVRDSCHYRELAAPGPVATRQVYIRRLPPREYYDDEYYDEYYDGPVRPKEYYEDEAIHESDAAARRRAKPQRAGADPPRIRFVHVQVRCFFFHPFHLQRLA